MRHSAVGHLAGTVGTVLFSLGSPALAQMDVKTTPTTFQCADYLHSVYQARIDGMAECSTVTTPEWRRACMDTQKRNIALLETKGIWDTTAPDAEIRRVHEKAHEYRDDATRSYDALTASGEVEQAQQRLDACGGDQQACTQARTALDGLWKQMHEAQIDKYVFDQFHGYAVCVLRSRGYDNLD